MNNPDLQNLTQRFLAEGLEGIDSQIDRSHTDALHRFTVLNSVRKAIDTSYIGDQTLDKMLEIYEACIAEALSIAGDDEELIEYANVMSYNLAANLADCWDDATEPRTTKHFKAGLQAANRCLQLRTQLNKPPFSFAMAYFVLGVHEYSLQNYSKAEKAWVSKLDNELLALEKPAAAENDLNVLLSQGLIGLARWSSGADNDAAYRQSMRDLDAVRTADNSAEIDMFIDQLTLLQEKHAPVATA